MALEESHVRRAAHLARLAVSDDQASSFVDDLSRILDMVDQLQSLDTERRAAVPSARCDPAPSRRRGHRNESARYVPTLRPRQWKNGLYLVPRVVE